MWGKTTKQRKSAVRRTTMYQARERDRLAQLAADAGARNSFKEKALKKRVAKKLGSGTVVGRLTSSAPMVQEITKPRRARKPRNVEA